MKSMIPPTAYCDEATYEAEQHAFRQHWQFIGFTSQLQQNQDFVCGSIGGHSVVVQNFHGELRAFHNVCSHRFAQIQSPGCGNRPLQCPYHGWTYDSEGCPVGIPKRPRFDDLTPDCLVNLTLTKWRVETCGSLVFVTETHGGPSLSQFLGDTFESIKNQTVGLGKLLDVNEMTIQANWKILVENTLESYHVNFVHGDSFKRLGVVDGTFSWQAPHSSWSTDVSPTVRKAMSRALDILATRPYSVDGYYHQLIFPNVTIATTFGTSFSIQKFEPTSPSSTKFTSYLFETAVPNINASQAAVLEALGTSAIKFNRQVFDEDKVVCESVQRGSFETNRTGMLSDEELRVAEFQRAYVDRFGTIQQTNVSRVLIVGGGDFGREVFEWVSASQKDSGEAKTIGFIDDDPHVLDRFPALQPHLAGRISDYQPLPGDRLLMAISEPSVKLRLGRALMERGAVFDRLIHPSAVIASDAKIGIGAIVCPNVVISCSSTIGDFVTLNCSATVGHDARVGDGCTLCCHCDITGHVQLGEGVFMGSHASVLPKVKVGDFARIGAGSVAIRTVKPHATMMGVPATRLDLPGAEDRKPKPEIREQSTN